MNPSLVRLIKLNLQEPHLDMEELSARPAGVNPPASGYIDCPCLKRQTKKMFQKSSENITQTLKIKKCVRVRACEKERDKKRECRCVLLTASWEDAWSGPLLQERQGSRPCASPGTFLFQDGQTVIFCVCWKSRTACFVVAQRRRWWTYLDQERSWARHAEGRRPRGCRTAAGGGAACGGAAPLAHCWTASAKTKEVIVI